MTGNVELASASEELRNVEIIPRGTTFGAEVRGIDLSTPVSPDVFQALHGALMDHKVIFFREVG